MKEKNYCVYLHTVLQKTSGYKYKKYYVGITNDINRRWGNNGEGYKGQIFYSAIKKYGWNNIKHTILYSNLTKEKAMEKEKEMILKYHSKVGDRGYNVSDGGGHISDKRNNAVNIYCIDTNQFFHNCKIAHKYLDEDEKTIRSKCNYHKNGFKNIKKGYRYCYAEEAYLYLSDTFKGDEFFVNIKSNECGSPRYLRKKYGKRIITRSRNVKTIEDYYDILDKKVKKRTYDNVYLTLKDYLYIYDFVTMNN